MDPSSVCSTHVKQLTTISNSSSQESVAIFLAYKGNCAHVHKPIWTYAHIHTIENKLFLKILQMKQPFRVSHTGTYLKSLSSCQIVDFPFFCIKDYT